MLKLEDLYSRDNIFLIPPRFEVYRDLLITEWEKLKLESHVFILSSGTTARNQIKTYALSKKSLLANADAVNQFLDITLDNIWTCSLPFYHVGGLSIFIRALLGDNMVHQFSQKWSASEFVSFIKSKQTTHSSLVPTQLFDIVREGLRAPSKLKGVFIGGDFLPSVVKNKAILLGWPIIETYGATEFCSQFASSFSSKIEEGFLEILPIHTIDPQTFYIKSKSLYTLSVVFSGNNFSDSETIYPSENFQLPDDFDFKSIDGRKFLRPLGREGDEFKCNGRLINLLELKDIFSSIMFDLDIYGEGALKLIESDRRGKEVVVVLEEQIESLSSEILNRMNSILAGICFVNKVDIVISLNKTELGKVRN